METSHSPVSHIDPRYLSDFSKSDVDRNSIGLGRFALSPPRPNPTRPYTDINFQDVSALDFPPTLTAIQPTPPKSPPPSMIPFASPHTSPYQGMNTMFAKFTVSPLKPLAFTSNYPTVHRDTNTFQDLFSHNSPSHRVTEMSPAHSSYDKCQWCGLIFYASLDRNSHLCDSIDDAFL